MLYAVNGKRILKVFLLIVIEKNTKIGRPIFFDLTSDYGSPISTVGRGNVENALHTMNWSIPVNYWMIELEKVSRDSLGISLGNTTASPGTIYSVSIIRIYEVQRFSVSGDVV